MFYTFKLTGLITSGYSEFKWCGSSLIAAVSVPTFHQITWLIDFSFHICSKKPQNQMFYVYNIYGEKLIVGF